MKCPVGGRSHQKWRPIHRKAIISTSFVHMTEMFGALNIDGWRVKFLLLRQRLRENHGKEIKTSTETVTSQVIILLKTYGSISVPSRAGRKHLKGGLHEVMQVWADERSHWALKRPWTWEKASLQADKISSADQNFSSTPSIIWTAWTPRSYFFCQIMTMPDYSFRI